MESPMTERRGLARAGVLAALWGGLLVGGVMLAGREGRRAPVGHPIGIRRMVTAAAESAEERALARRPRRSAAEQLARHDLAEAATIFREVLARDGERRRALTGLCRCQQGLGQVEAAEATALRGQEASGAPAGDVDRQVAEEAG